ncbi:hypothetical protein ACFPYI_02030 [Halomarina salina]|uniref:DUF1059 domain-containing protein n=1 Tax=Halomarina salina TaxID=1872699 RepID=A0ABD5RIT6_9EURY|nr:hypothetical protein [Halomarina salina]
MPTSGWRLSCTHCAFESATSGRDLAESMASTHESATGHSVSICQQSST